VKILNESESLATPSSVNGMGEVNLPTDTSDGSGDFPTSLNKKNKIFKRFKEFTLIYNMSQKK